MLQGYPLFQSSIKMLCIFTLTLAVLQGISDSLSNDAFSMLQLNPFLLNKLPLPLCPIYRASSHKVNSEFDHIAHHVIGGGFDSILPPKSADEAIHVFSAGPFSVGEGGRGPAFLTILFLVCQLERPPKCLKHYER
jgi:hypothetical protein